MQALPRKSFSLLVVSLMLVFAGASGCRNRAETNADPENSAENRVAVQQQATTANLSASAVMAGEAAAATGYQSTPINPTRIAVLASQSEAAQINVRSQPTTQSESLGFAQPGDQVDLLLLAEGEGGYSWYFLKIAGSQTEGWIRGDFIDTSGQRVATAQVPEVDEPAAAAEVLPDDQGVCGRDRQEAYFETDSFTIHICNTGDGLRYVGLNKENQESLVTEDVSTSQGTYVAIDGSYQYHINNNSLAVYQVHQGDYQPLTNETVTRHERFIY